MKQAKRRLATSRLAQLIAVPAELAQDLSLRGIHMKTSAPVVVKDVALEAAKREHQARSRALVESGARTQQSMYLFSPDIVKTLKIRHRATSFD